VGRSTTLVETNSINFIPLDQRHGRASNLFFVWFSANMELPVVAAGAATIAAGLSLQWSIVAIVSGALVGAVLMAYHSAQGPSLGLPQMIQSRAQFGFYGASFPLVVVVLLYLGFYAAGAVLGGVALHGLIGLPTGWALVVMGVLTVIVTIAGHDVIHVFMRYMAYFLGAAFLVLTITYATTSHTPSHPGGHFLLGPFLAGLEVAAMTQLGYAPYVADYSRYLPRSQTVRATFGWTYLGVSLSGIWLMILGAFLENSFPGEDPALTLHGISLRVGGWFGPVTYLALIAGIMGINALNLYGAYMSSLACIEAFRQKWRRTLRLRLTFIIPIAIVATGMSFLYEDNLLNSYENFLIIGLGLLVPWTAINLVDFYFVRHGEYSVPDIQSPSGIYGRVSIPGVVAYVIGFLIQVPFMVNAIFTGPGARLFGGGDVSWVIGALVAAGIYLVGMRHRGERAGEAAVTAEVAGAGKGQLATDASLTNET
jgi:NCS1 family nucleobase:cation symporter-1